ncbi:MAG TPA: c-type cytochrome [Steroidobacteraceae bacterium]|nr:c-type cytochrome [Steroidobacteraceae bacterium]
MTSRQAWLAMSLTLALLAPGLSQAADKANGAKLAYTCHGCHGIPNYKNAYPIYSVPKIGGQHVAYMVVALKEYQDGNRAHATMHAQAVSLKEKDLADIAAYLAGDESKPSGRPVGTAPKAGQTCVACHGNDGVGILPEYPNLAGQHEDYLANSLRAYKSGVRKNAIMAGMAAPLTEQDIRELAKYYSAQRPGLCATDEIRKNGKCKDR